MPPILTVISDFRRKGLKNLFYEDTPLERPLNFLFSYRIKKAIWILIFFLPFFIFFAWFKFTIAVRFSVAIVYVMTGVYVWYYYIVFQELILNYPPERIFWQQLLYPLLLFLAYLFYFFYALYEKPIFKLFYLSFFFFLYFSWLMRDDLIRRNSIKKRYEKTIWIIIDIVVLAAFSFSLWSEIFGVHYKKVLFLSLINNYSKDISVIFSIAFFYILNRGLLMSNKEVSYTEIYTRFLSYLKVVPPKDSIQDLFKGKTINKILDFGCGNGRRLFELSEFANIKLDDKLITAYDINENWKPDYKDIFEKAEFQIDKDKILKDKYDLIYFSHVLYSEDLYQEIREVINLQDNKCIIVFRGNSPNSFFISISFFKSTRIFGNNRSHIWYNYWLANLIKTCKLKRINEKINIDPDVLVKCNQDSINIPDIHIKQTFNLNNQSLKFLVDFLEFLYDEDLKYTLADYYSSHIKYHGSNLGLNCDDMIYVYEINK